MSDQQRGKKMVEQEDLYLFLEAYKHTTGESLDFLGESERPDFICQRADRTPVGVELTKVMRTPQSASWDRILDGQEFRDVADTNDAIWFTAENKSRKLKAGPWQHAGCTILVLQVMDCPLSELHRYFEDSTSPDDYAELGFSEVWVADYSELDAYGEIELFGLFPERSWGYYERWRGKPYG